MQIDDDLEKMMTPKGKRIAELFQTNPVEQTTTERPKKRARLIFGIKRKKERKEKKRTKGRPSVS